MKKYLKIAAIAAIAILFFCLQNALADTVKRKILQNGLIVLANESHKSPLVAIEVRVKTGSATEQGYLGSGISHFVEHMIFKGTHKRPNPGDIEREVKALGGYTNAFTSQDSTGFQFIVPSEYIKNALDIAKDILTDSIFDPSEAEKERNVILKELRLGMDDPGRRVSQMLWLNMFKVHNYRFPVIGYENLFLKIKRDDLAAYFKARYVPDNMVLSISGDVDAEEALKDAQDSFGGIARTFTTQVFSGQEPPQIAGIEAEEDMAISSAYITLGFHSVAVRDKDLFSLDVLAIVLGQGADSRLYKSLYRDKQLVYSVNSSNYTPKDPGIFAVSANLKKENCRLALDEVWRQIEELKKKKISDAELEKAKNQVVSGYLFSRQTVEEVAADLGSSETVSGDYDFSKKYVEGIQAVTSQMVLDAAKRYLTRDNSTLVRLMPSQAAAPAGAGQGTAAQPKQAKIEAFELKNNLRVILVEDRSLPIVGVTAVGLGGLRSENYADNGIANLVSQALLCGTGKMTEDQIISKVESLGASLNAFSGSSSFGLSAACLKKDFDTVLGIFSDTLQNAQFPPDKIAREKVSVLGNIADINDDIYSSGMRTLKYILFKGHPYRYQATGRPATVSKLTRSQLVDYYRAYYRPDNMVIAVSGDMDKTEAINSLTAAFKKFENGAPVKIASLHIKKKTVSRQLKRDMEKEQSLVLLGYLGATVNSHDEYVLELLSSVMSGVNGRLSSIIREKKGAAYALDARSVPGLERGFVVFYVGTTKENMDMVRDELFKEIELLKKEGVTEEELRSAKNETVGLYRIGLQRSQDIGLKASLDELYGFRYDEYLKYDDRIGHITRQCLLRAARKYFNPNSYVLFMIRGIKEREA